MELKVGMILRDSYPASKHYNRLYKIESVREDGVYVSAINLPFSYIDAKFIYYEEFRTLMYKLSPEGTILYGI